MIRWMVMPLYKQRCFGGRKKIAELERPGGKYGKLFDSTGIGQLDCNRDHCDHFDPGNPYDSQTYERGRRLLWRTKGKGTKEKMDGPKLRELTVHIEGMHCQNCKNRIEKHVNELDGVICKVKLNKKIAVVSLYKDVDESLIKDTIEKLDFTVVGME